MAQPAPLDRLTELVEAAAGVVEETDLDRVLRRLVLEAMNATGAMYAALGIIGEHGVLSDFLYEGMTHHQAAEIGNLPTGKGVLGTVIRLNQTIRLDDISTHPDTVGFPPGHPPMDSFLGVPVAVGERAFGNLYLTNKSGGFGDQDVMVVEALSRIAGAAVSTARLHERLRRVAVIEDRQRIAQELHDSVIQEMFAVGLGLQGLSQLVESPQMEATLLDSVDRLDNAVETLRRYIFQLRDAESGKRALDERLQELVSRMGSAYPADVTLEVSLESATTPALDDEVLKLVTEALSNALRHAEADTVDVKVAVSEPGCVIRVRDDGKGFDVGEIHDGMGLGNLSNRVKRLGGELTIESSESGTTVQALLPLG
jgi:two-component system, NarL family, sensor histidine kinase DevS